MPRPRIYRSNAERQAAYRRRIRIKVWHRSQKSHWETPKDLFAALDAEFGFTLDVCATPDNAQCERFFTPHEDGLKQRWEGVCWCNPPYGNQGSAWVKKAYESWRQGATVVCLLPARTDTTWWHEYVMKGAEVRFLRGRLKFVGGEYGAPFPSVLVVFRAGCRE